MPNTKAGVRVLAQRHAHSSVKTHRRESETRGAGIRNASLDFASPAPSLSPQRACHSLYEKVPEVVN